MKQHKIITVSKYNPPHTQYSHAIDWCYRAWRNFSTQNAVCVLDKRKTQKELCRYICVYKKVLVIKQINCLSQSTKVFSADLKANMIFQSGSSKYDSFHQLFMSVPTSGILRTHNGLLSSYSLNGAVRVWFPSLNFCQVIFFSNALVVHSTAMIMFTFLDNLMRKTDVCYRQAWNPIQKIHRKLIPQHVISLQQRYNPCRWKRQDRKLP